MGKAKVTVQVVGGDRLNVLADTVLEAMKAIDAEGYAATVNDEPASESFSLSDGDFVKLSAKVKAGN